MICDTFLFHIILQKHIFSTTHISKQTTNMCTLVQRSNALLPTLIKINREKKTENQNEREGERLKKMMLDSVDVEQSSRPDKPNSVIEVAFRCRYR